MYRVLWALRHIKESLLESVLIIIAIGLGIGALCSVTALIITFDQQMESQYKAMETIQIIPVERDRSGLWGFGSDAAPVKLIGRADAESVTLTLDDVTALSRDVPAVKHAFVRESFSVQLEGAEPRPDDVDFRTPEGRQRLREWMQKNQLRGSFVFPEAFELEGLRFAQGGTFHSSDIEEGRLVAVIGANVAERLFGRENPLGKKIRYTVGRRTKELTVVGVLTRIESPSEGIGRFSRYFSRPIHQLNDMVFVPFTARAALRGTDEAEEVNEIMVIPKDDVGFAQALAQVRAYVADKYGPAVSVTSQLENIRAGLSSARSLGAVVAIFGSVALIIAAINTLNLMMARALRRTKRFGISAALGLSRLGIFAQFLTECLLLSLGGMLAGMGITHLLVRLFTRLLPTGLGAVVTVSPGVWAAGLALSFVATLIFGVYPSLQAAGTDVVEALRTE